MDNNSHRTEPPFMKHYGKFHRVFAEILRDALDMVVAAQTQQELRDARAVCKALIETYDLGRAKWSPDALWKAVDA